MRGESKTSCDLALSLRACAASFWRDATHVVDQRTWTYEHARAVVSLSRTSAFLTSFKAAISTGDKPLPNRQTHHDIRSTSSP